MNRRDDDHSIKHVGLTKGCPAMRRRNCKCSNQSVKNSEPSFPLTLADAGEKVRIVCIRGGAKLKERLFSMGIQVESAVHVIQSCQEGAVLVAKNENRFMLGGGMAQKIYVTKE